jgi:hypothetical protein
LFRAYRRGLDRVRRSFLNGARDNYGVSRIVRNAASFRENFQERHSPIRLINHGMRNGSNDSNGLALALFDGNADVRMSDQAVGFQNLRDLLLGLQFSQPGNMQTHGNQWDPNGAGLAHAYFTAEFFYVEDVNGQHIARADNVVVGHPSQSGGQLANAVVHLLRRLKNGLRVAGRRQRHSEQGAQGKTPRQRTQSGWLHENR